MRTLGQILTIACLLTITLDIKGQCIADTGNDTIICVSLWGVDTTQIGGNPTASGGIPPYTYTWEGTVTTGASTYTASYFLDDTTASNPNIVNWGLNSITLYLTVTDSTDNTCTDTILVQFSMFYYWLGYYETWIAQGDSVQLFGPGLIVSDFPPFQYLWQPSNGLTDSTGSITWASPDTTTSYYLTVTDFAGCTATGGPFYIVHVSPVGIEDLQNEVDFELFPNPLTHRSTLRIMGIHKTDLTIEFNDALGHTTKRLTTTKTEIEINRTDFDAGVYFYRLLSNDRTIGHGKLIVE